MQIIREKLKTPISQELCEIIWENLSRVYRPTIHQLKRDLRKRLGIEKNELNALFEGELYFTDTGQVLYYQLDEDLTGIETGTVLIGGEGEQTFQGFREAISDLIGQGRRPMEWKPVLTENPRFDLIKSDCQVLSGDPQEMDAAFLLKDEQLRNLLKLIEKKSPCFQDELITDPEDFKTVEVLNSLESMGLINKEFFIFCRRNGQQISKVNSLSAIEDARSHGFRCFACGNLLSEERISPQLRTSPLGSRFACPNYWLALHAAKTIREIDPNLTEIYYSTEKDNRVFDLFVNSHQRFLMMETLDVSMKMDEVFMFLTRVNFYKPFRAILISSEPVGRDIKMYLDNFKTVPITLIEGLDNLKPLMESCLKNIRTDYVRSIFSDFRRHTEIPISSYFIDRFFGQFIQPEDEEERIAVMAMASGAQAIEEEPFGAIEEFTEVIPGEELAYEEPSEDELAQEALETVEMQPQLTTELPTAQEVPPQADLILQGHAENSPMESVEEIDIQLEQAEESILQEMADQAGEFAEEYFPMDFTEALPEEIIPGEDIMPALENTDEKLEKAAKTLLNELSVSQILKNPESVEKELSEISGVGYCSALISDRKGFLVLSNSGAELDPDPLCAYGSFICQSVMGLMKDSGFEPPAMLQLEGIESRIKVFPGGNLYLIAFEEKKTGEIDEESGTLPGEATLREAILKKVLDDLSRTEGVLGNLVAGPDGLVIESMLPDEMDPDSVGFLSGQLFFENKKYLEKILKGSVRQVLIKTGETLFSLIPVEEEAILTTCLNPQTPKEAWNGVLLQAGQMLASVLT